MPLNICGYCGKKVSYADVEKVIMFEHANVLCSACRKLFYAEIEAVAKKYLDRTIWKKGQE